MPGFDYKVTVTGAGQGAAEVNKLADAGKKVADATGKAAPQAKGLKDSLDALGSSNNAAKDVLEGISTAARGGEGAIFGITKALRAFMSGGIATLNPFALMIAGAGILIGLLPKIVEALSPVKKSAEEVAAELAKIKEEAAALGRARIETLKSDLDLIENSAANALERFKQLADAAQKIDDAQRTLELAKVEADSKLSAEERTRRTQQINSTFDQRKSARGVGVNAEEVRIADEAAQKAQQEESAAAAERTAAANKLKALRPAVDAQLQALKDQLAVDLEAGKFDEFGATAALFNFNRAASPLEERKKAIASGEDPEAARLRQELADADKRLELANQKTLGLNQRAGGLKERFAIDAQTRAAIDPIDKQTTDIRNKAAIQKAKQSDGTTLPQLKARADALGTAAESAAARGDSGEQNSAANERRQVLREIEKAKVNAKPLEDANAQVAAAVTKSAEASNTSINASAELIKQTAVNLPPPVDLGPLVASIKEGFGVIGTRLNNIQSQADQNARDIRQLAQQMQNSRK